MRSDLGTGVRRAWALVSPRERRRLKLIAGYGVLIAALDTIALVLIYGLINLLNSQPSSGVTESVIRDLHLAHRDRYAAALILLAITGALFVTRSLLSVLGLWLSVGNVYAAETVIISRLLRGHAHAPQLARVQRNSSETLRTIVNAVDQAIYGIVFSSVSLLANLAVAVAVAVGLLLSSPLVALTVTVYFGVIALAWSRGVRNPLARRGLRIQQLHKERYKLMLQGFAASKELQLRGRPLFYAEEAVTKTQGINDAMRVNNVASGSLRYMLETSLVVGAVVVVAAAGLTGGRDAVLPSVGLVLAGAFRLLPALNQVLFLGNQVHFSTPALAFVEQEMATFGSFADREYGTQQGHAAPRELERELRLDHVFFSYPGRPVPALKDVSLVVERGTSLGIVGATGSGKSTLLDVMLGFLQPDAGQVLVDDLPLHDQLEAWQRSVGYVPQDVYLVDDTLRANVALGWRGDEIDQKRVSEAIRLAGLELLVETLPERLDTVVGERGARLSGGQRQRVGLARALYTRPSILVLDEATSNLDDATEHRIVDTLVSLQGGLTIMFVTHRAASAQRCDRIVRLEAGEIRAEGSFEELWGATV